MTAVQAAPGGRTAARPAGAERRSSTLRVVARRRARRRAGVLAVLSLFVVFGMLFCIVALQAVIAAGQQRLDANRRAIVRAEADHQRLALVVAELESPRAVVATARDRLGMVTPERITYLTPAGDLAIEAERAAQQGAERQATGR